MQVRSVWPLPVNIVQIAWFLTVLTLAGPPLAAQRPRTDPAPVASAREEPTVSSGTGFILSASGYVATNHHVIEGGSLIELQVPGRTDPLRATVVAIDPINDLAVLRVDGLTAPATAISFADSSSVRVGQDTFTLGYPLGAIMGSSVRLSTGTINALAGINDDPRHYQISNPIQPGNSGGPLFNKDGQLVGIVVAQIDARALYEDRGIIPQNINFAVKGSSLRNLLEALPEGSQVLRQTNTLQGATRERQVEALTPLIVKVISYSAPAPAPPPPAAEPPARAPLRGRTPRAPDPEPAPAAAPAPRAPTPTTAAPPPTPAPPPPPPPSAPPAPSVEGLSPDQVIELLGKPAQTLDARDGVTTWYYNRSGSPLRVYFYQGKASVKRQR